MSLVAVKYKNVLVAIYAEVAIDLNMQPGHTIRTKAEYSNVMKHHHAMTIAKTAIAKAMG